MQILDEMWLKWKTIYFLMPFLCSLYHFQYADVIFTKSGFIEIPQDLKWFYYGTKPSLISCGIQCLDFLNVFSAIACKDSIGKINCYCTQQTDFNFIDTDRSCKVFTKPKCKNGGYFDGRLCNCEEGLTGSFCEIDVGPKTCVNETITIVDPMDETAINTVLSGQGTLKQQVHIADHDVIYSTIFVSLGFKGRCESGEYLETDKFNLSNADVYRDRQMFNINNTVTTLRLGFDKIEIKEVVNGVQLKGLIGQRIGSTNVRCLEVENSQITYGSPLECYLGLLKGYLPTFIDADMRRIVDSALFKDKFNDLKFLPTMTRGGSGALADIIGHHQINTIGIARRLFWKLSTHSLSNSMYNDRRQRYRIYLDTNWHLAYSNDQDGNPTHGFLAYLNDSLLDGKKVRVAVKDRIYSVASTSISDQAVTVHLTDKYDEDAWAQGVPVYIRQKVSTSGDYRVCSFEFESESRKAISNGSESVTWFIENRCWVEIIKFDSNKEIESGSVLELFEAASSGRSLRIVVTYSPTSYVIVDINQVHLFNSSYVVLDTGSIGQVEPNECTQASYTFYSDGSLEYLTWIPGKTTVPLRNFEDLYHSIQVFIEQ